MSKSNWLENSILKDLYGSGASTVYLALYSTSPGDSDSGTELSGGGYARKALTPGTHLTVSGNTATNPSAITFNESTGSQGTAAHFGLRTAATGGNLLHYGALSPSQNINAAGITLEIPANSLEITED